jgi:hypothetical protein
MLSQIHNRHHVGSECGRRQIDKLPPVAAEFGVMLSVGFSGGSVEYNADVGELPHREQTLNAAVGDRHSHAVGSL